MPTLEVGDSTIYYEIEGSGQVITLLHGHGGTLRLFDGLTDFLKKDYTVLRYDQRGYGSSGKPIKPTYSTELWANDLYQVLENLGISRVIVGGHSMSGRICATFAMNHQHMVDGLITFNTTWFGANPKAAVSLEKSASRIEREGLSSVLKSSSSYNSILENREEIREIVKAMIMKNDPVSYANGSRAVALDFKGGSRKDILESLKCPTQIIIGDRDSAPLEGALRMLRGITDSRLAVIPGSGHYSILEKPHLIKNVVSDFLRDAIK